MKVPVTYAIDLEALENCKPDAQGHRPLWTANCIIANAISAILPEGSFVSVGYTHTIYNYEVPDHTKVRDLRNTSEMKEAINRFDDGQRLDHEFEFEIPYEG